MNGTLSFKRMVLALTDGSLDTARLNALANFADQLQLEVRAGFLDDPDLKSLSLLPIAREFRSNSTTWQAVASDRLQQEIQFGAEATRRRLSAILGRRRLRASFEVKETAVDLIGRGVGDIHVVLTSCRPADTLSRQFAHLAGLVFSLAPTIMLVPPEIARTRGPVVAVATHQSDAIVSVAMAVASATNERLLLLRHEADDGRSVDGTAPAGAELPIERLPIWRGEINPARLASHLAGVNERLVVAPRHLLGRDDALAVVSLLKVPVILTAEQGPTNKPPD